MPLDVIPTNLVWKTIRPSILLTSSLGVIGGALSDFFQPWAPLALYISLGATIGFGILLTVVLTIRRTFAWVTFAGLFMLATALSSGAFAVLQNNLAAGPSNGFLSFLFPSIADVQTSLGLAKTRDNSSLSNALENRRQSERFDKMRSIFRSLGNEGGIVKKPELAEHYYYNARTYEFRGDVEHALEAYVAFFRFGLDVLGPHLRYVKLLKQTHKPEDAHSKYLSVAGKPQLFSVQVAASSFEERPRRMQRLRKLIEQQPELAPAYYILSSEFSKTQVGTQSPAERRKERELLQHFLALGKKGHIRRWFIDDELCTKWKSEAAKRLLTLGLVEVERHNEVKIDWTTSHGGWAGIISLPEPATEILWKKSEDAFFTSTGLENFLDPETDEPKPKNRITLPLKTTPRSLDVKYRNIHGELVEPYSVFFDPTSSILEDTKETLNLTLRRWVYFREHNHKIRAHFNYILGYRGALKTIKYAVNSDQPDQSFVFPPHHDPRLIGTSPGQDVYVLVPENTQYIVVQLDFKDGTKSVINRIER